MHHQSTIRHWPRRSPCVLFGLAAALIAAFVSVVPAPSLAGEKGYVGLEVRDLEQTEAETLGWEAPRGVFVVTLFEDGPALEAGVAAGDIIVSIDGSEIDGIEEFVDVISGNAPGAGVRLRLLRERKERRVTVILGTRPASQPLAEKCARFMPTLGRSIEVPCRESD